MKILKVVLSIPLFLASFLFIWMFGQAGFEVLPQTTSFWEVIRTLIGMAALLFYGCLGNWTGCKIWEGK